MKEQTSQKVRASTYLMGATVLFYGSLVLFLRLGGNFSTNPFWPIIRVGCKWTLFAWMVYLGVLIGKKISTPLILELKSKIQNLESDLLKSKEEQSLIKEGLAQIQERHSQELQDQKNIESSLRAKLQRYKRTPAEASRLALRDFL